MKNGVNSIVDSNFDLLSYKTAIITFLKSCTKVVRDKHTVPSTPAANMQNLALRTPQSSKKAVDKREILTPRRAVTRKTLPRKKGNKSPEVITISSDDELQIEKDIIVEQERTANAEKSLRLTEVSERARALSVQESE